MHILFLTDRFPPESDAASSRVYERACYWVKWGYAVTVITCAPNHPEGKVFPGYRNHWYQSENIDGIQVIRVKTYIAPNEGFVKRTFDFLSFMISAFAAGLFQKKVDVVIASSPQLFAAVGGWALAAVRRLPFVLELADLWPATISAVGAMRESALLSMLERLELFLYRRSSAVIALTPAFQHDLVRRGIPQEKIFVVVNGVDLSRYAPREKDKDLVRVWGLQDKFVVGYVGTHGIAHALENVLEACERLKSASDICFVFIGTGAAKEDLVRRAKKKQLSNIVFIPPQPKETIARFWSLCDVALVHLKNVPIFKTVIPSKIFEAMGMGLPILFAGPKGEASEIIERENAGICVSAENAEQLANVALRLCYGDAERQALARNSAQAASRYTRERQAMDSLTVLQLALTKRPTAFADTHRRQGGWPRS